MQLCPTPTPVPSPQGGGERLRLDTTPSFIAALAADALLAELATYPKPGLVSLVDSGSHDDMDAATFRRSVAAIAPFFARLAQAGADGAPLADLRAIGLDAEAAMLAATGGVNTHRGAIFALGLLCAAAGAGAPDLAAHVRDTWGEALARERPGGSHGGGAMRRYAVGGARGEAASGFPGAMRVGLPALREGRRLAGAHDPSPACGRRWPDEVGSDEGAGREATVPSNTLFPVRPHPTPLRGATFSREREKGKTPRRASTPSSPCSPASTTPTSCTVAARPGSPSPERPPRRSLMPAESARPAGMTVLSPSTTPSSRAG